MHPIVSTEKDALAITDEIGGNRWFVAGINVFHPISALGRSIGAKELAVISSQPVMKHHGVVSCEIGNLPQRSEIDWNGILRPWVQINNAIGAGGSSVSFPRLKPAIRVERGKYDRAFIER